jgi:Tol biopolymer transport system component
MSTHRPGAGIAALLSAVLAAAILLVAGDARAGDPTRVWKTIETRHFVIHYYEPLLDVAEKVAAAAERSHVLLTPVFDHLPEEKTQIVIEDTTDGANGSASVLPRNRIRLFATAPSGASTLNDHDDWLYILTAHEYTHVLHLDSIGGLPKLVNKILGKTWAPNQVQPRWVIEGLATYEESKQSSAGRVRSALFDMNLRVATLANQRLDLDAVTNGPRDWPRGTAAYLYGSHFLDYVFNRYGDDKVRELSWSYGSNPIPYSLNRSIKRITGQSFEELYKDWEAHLRAKYSMQVEAVERAGLREGRRLTFAAEGNYNPFYTHDGAHIIWQQSDGYTQSRFRIMPVGGNVGRAEDYAVIRRGGEYDLLADGSMVIARGTNYRTVYDFQDLYHWDRKTGDFTRLTHGLRAGDPSVSPDESQVAFAINDRSQTRLAVMPLRQGAEHRILWEGERFDQASSPHWSPDGRYIAFSSWTSGGYRDIRVVDLTTGAVEQVTSDRALDIQPVFSPDGNYLYYVSDRSGIYNVYALDRKTGKTYQVTNVIGGALRPRVSPDGSRMVYYGFVLGGHDIYEIDLDPDRFTEPVPYVNDRPDPVVVPQSDVEISAPRPYRPLETLAPQSYILQLGQTTFGTALTVQTGGADVAGWHNYGLSATLDLDRKDVNFSASYGYSRLWPSLNASVLRDISQRAGVILDGMNTIYTRETYSLAASMGLPVLRTAEGSGQISVDYNLDWLRNAGDAYDEPDPNDTLPMFPDVDVKFAGMALRWSYSDVGGYARSVGPREGQSLSASLRVNHPALGSDFRSLVLSYRWDTYLPLPWGLTPTLAVRLAGGIQTSDRARSGAFLLGGVPEQDIARSVIESRRFGASGYLRGYPDRSVVGRQFHLANLEYRHMLFDIERGLSTLPIYVRRLHVAGLVDAGNAFDGDLDLSDFKVGVGGALRLDMMFGYFIPGTVDIGYARGLTSGGIGEYWLLLTGTL